MEISSSSSRPPERENPSPTNSPHSNGSSTTTSNGSSLHLTPTPPHTPTPTTKSAITRSHDGNPYPTTFVQADTTTFKQVVQMLTGASEAAKHGGGHRPDPSRGGGIPPIKSTGQKKQGFKLYERRNSLKNGLMTINTFAPPPGGLAQNSASPRKPEILSPSILDFPALVLSPITPMNEDTATAAANADQEERAIAEKKFYFHPSPRDAAPPQLLPLFPVTSPRVSGSTS